MRIITFASGSTGNCSLLSDGRANILIDAGISMRRVVTGLAAVGLSPRDICGVLITHEHSDHISGLSMLVKHYGLSVFAPEELADTLCGMKPELRPVMNYIRIGESIELGGVCVSAFPTSHDAVQSVGYRFEGDSVFAIATDTGCVTKAIVEALTGADTVLLEANHDVDMLRDGPYPYYLKRRVLSEKGHLSNSDCGKFALYLANHGTKHIILGHLSRENNTPELALRSVKGKLRGCEVELLVAPMKDMLAVTVGERLQCSV